MNSPEVSVVMAVRNGGSLLRESVASILDQRGVDFEFLIVDDASTDETTSFLADAAARDQRIRLQRNQAHQGITASLRAACSKATAPLIARHDADDLSLPGRLRVQADYFAEQPSVGFASVGVTKISAEGTELAEVCREGSPALLTRRMYQHREGPTAHGATMFRRSLYEKAGGYRLPFYYAQDSDLWLRMGELMHFGALPEVYYRLRVGSGAISFRHRALQTQFAELGHLCREARQTGQPEEPHLTAASDLAGEAAKRTAPSRSELAESSYFLGSWLLARDPQSARPHLAKAVRAQPWRLRNWLRFGQSCLAKKR